MFKLQIVLLPPSLSNLQSPLLNDFVNQQQHFNRSFRPLYLDNNALLLNSNNNPTSSNQLTTNNNNNNINNNNTDVLSNDNLQQQQNKLIDPNISINNQNFLSSQFNNSFLTSTSQTIPIQFKIKKFLLFTKPDNTLSELNNEILIKFNKMYPTCSQELEILSLQDYSGCDLDPDFLVKDVFNNNNIVNVLLKNDLSIDDLTPVSTYYNSNINNPSKRQKISSTHRNSISSQSSTTNNNGVLRIAKKRATNSISRLTPSINGTIRISTPLAHQIYPPQARHLSNNSDDEDLDDLNLDDPDRSFLPPPNQPQSPPIRISSGIDPSKKIKSLLNSGDTVSRSGTVDPDKSKQNEHFLQSNTPIIISKHLNTIDNNINNSINNSLINNNTMTPNRVTLSGPRVVSENHNRKSIFNLDNSLIGNISTISRPTPSKEQTTNSRITSGMLSVPEPRISEIEKELHEGPSSPSSILPPKADRIPMKKPYIDRNDSIDDDFSSLSDSSLHINNNKSKTRTISIADDTGSPVRNTPTSTNSEDVYLAELPINKSSPGSPKRKISIENKIKNKNINNNDKINSLRTFSDDQNKNDDNSINSINLEDKILLINSKNDNNKVNADDDNSPISSRVTRSSNYAATSTDDEEIKDANTTVQIKNLAEDIIDKSKTPEQNETKLRSLYYETGPNGSNNHYGFHKSDLLSLVKHDTFDVSNLNKPRKRKPKPYVTVLHKDIDNSKPDPRNILPERKARNAAKRAAKLLSSKKETRSEPSSANESFTSEDSDDIPQEQLHLNTALKKLNIHPLKETVISPSSDNLKNESNKKRSNKDNKRPKSNDSNASIISDSKVTNKKKISNEKKESPKKKELEKKESSKDKNTHLIDKTDSNKSKSSEPEKLDDKSDSNKPKSPVKNKVDSKSKNKKTEVKEKNNSLFLQSWMSSKKSDKSDDTSEVGKIDDAKSKARRESDTLLTQNFNADPITVKDQSLQETDKTTADKNDKEKVTISTSKNKKNISKKDRSEIRTEKLKDLKAKFTKSSSISPLPSQDNKSSSQTEIEPISSSDATDTSSDDDDDSSSDIENIGASIKQRRVVDTPRGFFPKLSSIVNAADVEDAPQSTQVEKTTSPSKRSPKKRSVEEAAPLPLPKRMLPSLSSLLDLASRGIPDVREKRKKDLLMPVIANKNAIVGDNDTDSSSSSESSDDSSDSSDEESKNFISSKSASKALGKKKKKPSGGFASLVKDLKKK